MRTIDNLSKIDNLRKTDNSRKTDNLKKVDKITINSKKLECKKNYNRRKDNLKDKLKIDN